MNTHGHPFHKFLRITATKLPTLGYIYADPRNLAVLSLSTTFRANLPQISDLPQQKFGEIIRKLDETLNTITTLNSSCPLAVAVPFSFVQLALPRILVRTSSQRAFDVWPADLNLRAKRKLLEIRLNITFNGNISLFYYIITYVETILIYLY